MRKVQDQARSYTGSGNNGKDSSPPDADERFAHIKSANRKVRLLDVLHHYGFKIEKNPQRPIWSNNIVCPLPSHKGAKERTPSFGYCFISDHCHCFGCNFTGRAVEFISAYEGVTRSSVAEKILAQYGDDVSDDEFKDYEDNISPILLDGSKFLQAIIQKHKHNKKLIKQVEKLIWWIDFYLINKAPGRNVDAKELQYRIDRVKDLLGFNSERE